MQTIPAHGITEGNLNKLVSKSQMFHDPMQAQMWREKIICVITNRLLTYLIAISRVLLICTSESVRLVKISVSLKFSSETKSHYE